MTLQIAPDPLAAGWYERETWLQREHPEIVAARAERHAFVPVAPIEEGHVCRGACYCDRCWLPKSDRIHPRRSA